MKINELQQLRKDVNELIEAFKELVDTLRSSQILFKGIEGKYQYKIFTPNIHIRTSFDSLENRLSKIIDHLNLEFEWIECKPHYELKEKEEE